MKEVFTRCEDGTLVPWYDGGAVRGKYGDSRDVKTPWYIGDNMYIILGKIPDLSTGNIFNLKTN